MHFYHSVKAVFRLARYEDGVNHSVGYQVIEIRSRDAGFFRLVQSLSIFYLHTQILNIFMGVTPTIHVKDA